MNVPRARATVPAGTWSTNRVPIRRPGARSRRILGAGSGGNRHDRHTRPMRSGRSVQLTWGRAVCRRPAYRPTAYGGPWSVPRGRRGAATPSVVPRASVPGPGPGLSGARPSPSSFPGLPMAPVQPGGLASRPAPGRQPGRFADVLSCHRIVLIRLNERSPAGDDRGAGSGASAPRARSRTRVRSGACLRASCGSGSCTPSTRASLAGVVSYVVTRCCEVLYGNLYSRCLNHF